MSEQTENSPEENKSLPPGEPKQKNKYNGLNWIGWIALIVAIIAIILIAIVWERSAHAARQFTQAEQTVSNLNGEVSQLNDKVSKQVDLSGVESELAQLKAGLKTLQDQQQQSHSGSTQSLAGLNTQLKTLEQTQFKLQNQIANIENQLTQIQQKRQHMQSDKLAVLLQVNAWVQNASGALALQQNTQQAIYYLQSAVQFMDAHPNLKLPSLKYKLKQDITNLQAVKTPDRSSILSSLNSLSNSVSGLAITPPKEIRQTKSDSDTKTPADEENWRGIKASLSGLKKLFVFRKVTNSEDAQLQPGQLILIRENIAQKIDQAAWAVLHNNAQLYKDSLNLAILQLEKNFLFEPDKTKPLITKLQQLQAINISPALPSLNTTQSLIKKLSANSSAASASTVTTSAAQAAVKPKLPKLPATQANPTRRPMLRKPLPPTIKQPNNSSPLKPMQKQQSPQNLPPEPDKPSQHTESIAI